MDNVNKTGRQRVNTTSCSTREVITRTKESSTNIKTKVNLVYISDIHIGQEKLPDVIFPRLKPISRILPERYIQNKYNSWCCT